MQAHLDKQQRLIDDMEKLSNHLKTLNNKNQEDMCKSNADGHKDGQGRHKLEARIHEMKHENTKLQTKHAERKNMIRKIMVDAGEMMHTEAYALNEEAIN
jgi:hypothetical protein